MKPAIRGRPDFLLFFITIVLVCFGLVMIFSASSPQAVLKHGNASYYLFKQGMFALVGGFFLLLFMRLPIQLWKRAAPFLLLTTLLLLILVLICGTNINGAKRWFAVGGLNFQPAEYAKLAIIVYLAALISRKGEAVRVFKTGLLPLVIAVGIVLLLVLLQPDFGTVIILGFIAGAVIVTGGVDLRHLLVLALGLLPVLVLLVVGKSYRLERLVSFVAPFDHRTDSGYQLVQSLYALGHGGVTGSGLGQSVQKLFYLPEAHTDFIAAVIGEELGFIGTLLLFAMFFVFILQGFMAAFKSEDPFAFLLGMGIVTMIGIQFVLNIGAVTGSLPITGVPLPFISYGGSSLVSCMACTGILLSISRDNNRRRQERLRQSQESKIEVPV
ncbi:putative lipid II flippase FtsW [Paenibacillus ehimensis]|uniref:Probable peptidoglycan glycosyltransferase FtsW n=1 Tax=Paenibacillus ehimensis TaxID=79264 RepID=A0ABT8VDM8_9BACL|nr:putative lipid II flippase FtsW [Paenibacillus ehimensis]MDO3679074.1 putative lipid II flippase FtsW [Paenibacillus ehimensis]